MDSKVCWLLLLFWFGAIGCHSECPPGTMKESGFCHRVDMDSGTSASAANGGTTSTNSQSDSAGGQGDAQLGANRVGSNTQAAAGANGAPNKSNAAGGPVSPSQAAPGTAGQSTQPGGTSGAGGMSTASDSTPMSASTASSTSTIAGTGGTSSTQNMMPVAGASNGSTQPPPPICQPGEMKCQSGELAVCDGNGQAFDMMSCPSGTKCVDPGLCAACVTDVDCASMTRGCKLGKCVNHMCNAEDADSSTLCTTTAGAMGKCGTGGTCECTPQCNKPCGDNGCSGLCPSKCGSSQMCVNDQCVDCVSDSDCSELNSQDGCTTGTCKGGRCAKKNQDPMQCTTADFRRARGTCQDGVCTCNPNCSGRCSGSDGCNGSCNEQCDPGQQCGPTGTCQAKPTAPSGPATCHADCPSGDVCDTQLHYCTTYCDTGVCPADRQCANGSACVVIPPCPSGMIVITYSGTQACANPESP